MTVKVILTFYGRTSMAGIKQVVLRHYSENDCLLINKVIGNNLRVARQTAGYTQSQVMDITWDKKNRNRISDIENGKVTIDIYTFLILVDLYGQSVDFILGRSCEPINDVKAAFVNNVKLNTHKFIQPIIDSMTEVVVNNIKRHDIDKYLELMVAAKNLSIYAVTNAAKINSQNPELYAMLSKLGDICRSLEVKEAQSMVQMQAQLDAIAERHDKEDGHLLMSDVLGKKQYTLPLPEPRLSVVNVKDGN